MFAVLFLLFFFSGISGLVYQVIWVREFGTVFGNTIYSSSIVVAIFMLGLGVGSYVAGRWADRRYATAPESLLRAYGYVELLIAALAVSVTLTLPALGTLAARTSTYVADGNRWFMLSRLSYVARGAIACALLAPVTLLMGATLTLLVRHLVRRDVEIAGGSTIAWLYGVNTLGAAAGAFLTDYALVPFTGLRATQFTAIALNVIAGAGALALTRRSSATSTSRLRREIARTTTEVAPAGISPAIVWICAALGLSGFAAMGMEIVWLRHFTLLLGSFRSVFSLVITVVLVGVAAGSLVGAVLNRSTGRPAETLMAILALFVCVVLAGLGLAHFPAVAARSTSAAWTWADDLWHNLRPILFEAGLPSFLIGCSFPLGNAVIQRAEADVGRRAGMLYLANTVGAVAGSLITAFVLLPTLGMQGSATALAFTAGAAIVPLAFGGTFRPRVLVPVTSLLIAASALGVWFQLPPDHVVRRAMMPRAAGERLVSLTEGVNEIIEVTEAPGRGRALMTNGHPMSSTAWLDQRYMRALAHIPLLSIHAGARVLVIGFGVGNTTHAAALHSSVERIDVADLSRRVLEHAAYFGDVNGDVLNDRRVSVFINDGRQHLQMAPRGEYDLITLEPPPIAQAGVAALYSREFYALARTRLREGGYLSQWLPAYQVPADTSFQMVRAFLDVFPQSVLLSGMGPELLLLGTTGDTIDIDPDRVSRVLESEPAVRADLQRLDLAAPTQIVGMFVGSAATLARATTNAAAASDDRPLQEYVVGSAGAAVGGVPAALFDFATLASWCPRCFDGNHPASSVPGLDTYVALLDKSYRAFRAAGAGSARSSATEPRLILGSRYLGAVVPDTDAVYDVIGVTLLRQQKYAEAVASFREALARNVDSVDANRHIAAALAESGQAADAMPYLRHAVQVDPRNGAAQYELGRLLLDSRQFREAAQHFFSALRSMPESSSLHNDLGVALASVGDLRQAVEHFRRAVSLDPTFAEARRNLNAAERVEYEGS